MKKVTTTIIALFTIAASVFANNSNTSIVTALVNKTTVAICFTAANNTTVEIERSFYSNNFTSVAAVNCVFGGNMQINDNAAELAGRKAVYYRVKTIAADGTVSYSNTTVVNLTGTEGAVVTKSIINFSAEQNGNAVITLKNAAGKTVSVKNTIVSNGNNAVEVAEGLAKGFYTADVTVNGVMIATEKVIAE